MAWPSWSTREGDVLVRGHRTRFRVVEPAGGALRIPLLCLHGGPGLPHDYLEPLQELAASGHPVVFYDQLGCGRSDHHRDPALCSIAVFLEELNAVRSALALDEIHLFGHSWGGMLGLEYLLTRPAGVLSFVAASTLASMPLFVSEVARLRRDLAPEHRESTAPDAIRAFMQKHGIRLAEWPDCVMRAFAAHAEDDFVTRVMFGRSALEVTGTLRSWDVSERLHEIAVPTLVTCGRFDETTPRLARQIADGIKGSEVRVFDDSAHVAHLEETAAYLATLERFFARVERGR